MKKHKKWYLSLLAAITAASMLLPGSASVVMAGETAVPVEAVATVPEETPDVSDGAGGQAAVIPEGAGAEVVDAQEVIPDSEAEPSAAKEAPAQEADIDAQEVIPAMGPAAAEETPVQEAGGDTPEVVPAQEPTAAEEIPAQNEGSDAQAVTPAAEPAVSEEAPAAQEGTDTQTGSTQEVSGEAVPAAEETVSVQTSAGAAAGSDASPANASGGEGPEPTGEVGIPVLGAGIEDPDETTYQTENVTVQIKDNTLTMTVRGMSEEYKNEFMKKLEEGFETVVNKESLKIQGSYLPDAEKYMLSGYDEQLCWAATAANMLWTSNYAQQAVNPATGKTFQNVDEVFNYFRGLFTDQVGRPDGALSVFLEGAYPFTDTAGWSQLKEATAPQALLTDVDNENDETYKAYEMTSNVEGIRFLEELKDYSMGVLLRNLLNINNEYQYGGLAHWLTVAGIIYDAAQTELGQRYKAIILADSDNSYASYYNPVQTQTPTSQDYAEKAAQAENAYTVFPLILKDFGSKIGPRWVIPYTVPNAQDNQDVVLDWLAFLKDKDVYEQEKKAAEEAAAQKAAEEAAAQKAAEEAAAQKAAEEAAAQKAAEEAAAQKAAQEAAAQKPAQEATAQAADAPTAQNTQTAQNVRPGANTAVQTEAASQNQITPVPTSDAQNSVNAISNGSGDTDMKKKEYDFAKIKEQMIKDKLLVYSPTDWNYDREKDTTFDFFVRMPSTALRNLFLDEELLTEYHKDIKVTDKNNGIFLVEISEELMQKLPAEDHELLLQLTGVKDTKETIHVK